MSYVVIDVIISVLLFVALFYGFKRLQDRKNARRDAQENPNTVTPDRQKESTNDGD